MVNCVCSKYNFLLKKQFAVYSLGEKTQLDNTDKTGVLWGRLMETPIENAFEKTNKSNLVFPSFCKSSPYFLICSFL